MNLVGVGVDIVEIEAFKKMRFFKRASEFFLTENERASMQKRPDPEKFAAAHFAVKEAVIKAFPMPLKPHDFEIVKVGPKPTIRFLRGINKGFSALVSISHSESLAVGYAAVLRR